MFQSQKWRASYFRCQDCSLKNYTDLHWNSYKGVMFTPFLAQNQAFSWNIARRGDKFLPHFISKEEWWLLPFTFSEIIPRAWCHAKWWLRSYTNVWRILIFGFSSLQRYILHRRKPLQNQRWHRTSFLGACSRFSSHGCSIIRAREDNL